MILVKKTSDQTRQRRHILFTVRSSPYLRSKRLTLPSLLPLHSLNVLGPHLSSDDPTLSCLRFCVYVFFTLLTDWDPTICMHYFSYAVAIIIIRAKHKAKEKTRNELRSSKGLLYTTSAFSLKKWQ